MLSPLRIYSATRFKTSQKEGINTRLIYNPVINKQECGILNNILHTLDNIRPLVYDEKLIAICRKRCSISITSSYFYKRKYK